MTKGLFLNLPAQGHINPTLGLVKELVMAGDDIIYYCTPNYRQQITATGAQFRGYNLAIPEINPEKSPSFIKAACHFLDISLRVLSLHLQEWREEKPDYIIHDSCLYAGKIAGNVLGIKAISSTTTFTFTPEIIERMVDKSDAIKSLFLEPHCWLNYFKLCRLIKNKYNVQVELKDLLSCIEPLNITYTSRFFQPLAELLDESQHQFIGPVIDSRLEPDNFPLEQLKNSHHKQIIYISLGTMYNANIKFFLNCFHAFGFRKDFLVVVSLGKNIAINDLGKIPPNFIVRQSVPQLAILKYTKVFVSHSGMNSVNESLLHGIPMVLVPQQQEQSIVAGRIEDLGAGINLKSRCPDSRTLFAAVDKVLHNENYARAALVISSSFRHSSGTKGGVKIVHNYAFNKPRTFPHLLRKVE